MKHDNSRLCRVIEVCTPKKIRLNGLWLGPARPKIAYVWVHGLGSSLFSKLSIAELFVDRNAAVLVFNNRGHDGIARVSRVKQRSLVVGSAYEKFADCIDDIDGAIRFAKQQGAKKIYLVGHSTGCQKSLYWAARRKSKGIRGVVLLAPISDYAAAVHLQGKEKLTHALSAARALVGRGKGMDLLPTGLWHEVLSAQRFLSLYTGESAEELFPYWNTAKRPNALRSIRVPVLVLLAENDEYADRPAREMCEWFQKHIVAIHGSKAAVIPDVEHGFKGGEKTVASHIRKFLS